MLPATQVAETIKSIFCHFPMATWAIWMLQSRKKNRRKNTFDASLSSNTLGERSSLPGSSLPHILWLWPVVHIQYSHNTMIHDRLGCLVIKAHFENVFANKQTLADVNSERSGSEPVVPFCRFPKTGTSVTQRWWFIERSCTLTTDECRESRFCCERQDLRSLPVPANVISRPLSARYILIIVMEKQTSVQKPSCAQFVLYLMHAE